MKSKLYIWGLMLILSAVIFSGCGPATIGGTCPYVDIAGACAIISVVEPDAGTFNCSNDPVEVLFDFTPGDPDAAASYRCPEWPDDGQALTVAGGANPPREWVQAEGLTEGSAHPCVRKEIVRGTCTPVIFEFTEIDYSAGVDQCFLGIRGPGQALNVALAYINEHYGEQAPAAGLTWVGDRPPPEEFTDGFTIGFTSESAPDWVATVSYAVVAPEMVIWQIVVSNQTTGFQWEGEVDAAGQVTQQSPPQ